MKKSVVALVSLLIAATCRAQGSLDLKALVEMHGFEFQPRSESPWRVPLPDSGHASWKEIGNDHYLIDERQGYAEHELRDAIARHLSRYAEGEIELLALVILRAPVTYKFSMKALRIVPITQPGFAIPPLYAFDVDAGSATASRKQYKVQCRFRYFEVLGKYHLVHQHKGEWQSYNSDFSPHCDLLS